MFLVYVITLRPFLFQAAQAVEPHAEHAEKDHRPDLIEEPLPSVSSKRVPKGGLRWNLAGLDCLLLVPTFALARLTSRLRGGRLHHVWTALLAGFLTTAAGDVMFTNVTVNVKKV